MLDEDAMLKRWDQRSSALGASISARMAWALEWSKARGGSKEGEVA